MYKSPGRLKLKKKYAEICAKVFHELGKDPLYVYIDFNLLYQNRLVLIHSILHEPLLN